MGNRTLGLIQLRVLLFTPLLLRQPGAEPLSRIAFQATVYSGSSRRTAEHG